MQKYESLYKGKIIDTRRYTTSQDHYDIVDEFGVKMIKNTTRISHDVVLVDVDVKDVVTLTIYRASNSLVQIGQETYSRKVWSIINQRDYIEGLKRRYERWILTH